MVSYSTTVHFYDRLSQGAYMFVANRFFLQATATSNYVCWYLSPNTPEGHYNKRTLSKQQFRSGEHNPIAVKTIIDVNTINPLLTFTKRSTRCLFLRLKLNLFCTRGKLKYMPRVRFELTTSRLWDSRAAYCAIEAFIIFEHTQQSGPDGFPWNASDQVWIMFVLVKSCFKSLTLIGFGCLGASW